MPNIKSKSVIASYETDAAGVAEKVVSDLQGSHNGVAGYVERDPEGKPIWLHLTMPDTAAAAAVAALNASPGIAKTGAMVPVPPAILELDSVAGIVAAGAIFPTNALSGYIQAEWTNPLTGIGVNGGRLDAGGYTAGVANPDPQVYNQLALEFELLAGASGKIEFAADTIILKDTAGTSFALNHPKLTFNVPAQSKHRVNMYILGDELYLFFEVAAGSVNLSRKNPDQAVELAINPLSIDYVVN